jgi:hypothetical protein
MTNIKWVGCHPNNYSVGRGKEIKLIVLHWIVGTLESADATFANADRKASAHYGVGDNDIHQWVKEDDTAWHSGVWVVNQASIGIEHEGGWLLPDGTRKVPTDKTHETSGKLVADICRRYNIPIDRQHIVTHREQSATECPGTLDVDRIIQIAKDQTIPDPQPEKVTICEPWGEMELQAICSTLNDQKRDLENCEKNCEKKVEMAVEQALFENNEIWQKELDTANQRIEELEQTISDDLSEYPWQVLFKQAWINFFNQRG